VAKQKSLLYDVFFGKEHSVNRSYLSGLGLGLVICMMLLNKYDPIIWIIVVGLLLGVIIHRYIDIKDSYAK
jgi:K+-sensing histidine kinase KdpD